MIIENHEGAREGFADIVAGAPTLRIRNDGETNLALLLFLYPTSQVLKGCVSVLTQTGRRSLAANIRYEMQVWHP